MKIKNFLFFLIFGFQVNAFGCNDVTMSVYVNAQRPIKVMHGDQVISIKKGDNVFSLTPEYAYDWLGLKCISRKEDFDKLKDIRDAGEFLAGTRIFSISSEQAKRELKQILKKHEKEGQLVRRKIIELGWASALKESDDDILEGLKPADAGNASAASSEKSKPADAGNASAASSEKSKPAESGEASAASSDKSKPAESGEASAPPPDEPQEAS